MSYQLSYKIKLLVPVVAFLLLIASIAHPQHKRSVVTTRTNFVRIAAEAGLVFTYPPAFKEVKPLDNEDFSFDYGLTLPGQDFEVWVAATPLKKSWQNYERARAGQGQMLSNPDSAYLESAKAKAAILSVDGTYFERNIQAKSLEDYNADAGKTYLVNLNNSPETKHYSYALIITLQKDHVGNLLAVCLTNDRGPSFFKNINRLRTCLKFK